MLSEDQRNLIRQWIDERKTDSEIIELAKQQQPPFNISRQSISKYYRVPTGKKARQMIQEQAVENSLRSIENRIRELDRLYFILSYVITEATSKQDYRLLLSSVVQARGILDDLAKETGGRHEKVDIEAQAQIKRRQDIVAIMNRVYGEAPRTGSATANTTDQGENRNVG